MYIERISKDLINSKEKVDKRMLILHNIAQKAKKKTDLMNFLNVRKSISDLMQRSATRSLENTIGKHDQSNLLKNIFSHRFSEVNSNNAEL